MKGFRKGLVCVFGFLILNACSSKEEVHENISDIKYQVNRVSSPSDEKPYHVEDEFNFLDKYSGNAKIIKSDAVGECINDSNKLDIRTINTTINANKFKLGVVLPAEFLASTDKNTKLYTCHLTISGTTDVGSQVDVPVVLKWYQDDFLGIDLGIKKITNGYDDAEFELNLEEDFVLEVIQEYEDGSTDPSIRLVCDLDQTSPTGIVANSLMSEGPIRARGENNILHIALYILAMFTESLEKHWYKKAMSTYCVMTNNEFNTPEFKWSRSFDLFSLGASVGNMLYNIDANKLQDTWVGKLFNF